MSEFRIDPPTGGAASETTGSRETAEDLLALKQATARDVPTLDDTVRTISRRPHATLSILEEYAMATMELLKRRPGLATAVAIALAAVAMLVIPFSYERTSGHDVALTLSGGSLGPDQVRQVAMELKGLLHADHVVVNAANQDGRTHYILSARVPASSGIKVAAAARAFEAGLAKAGYTASTTIMPVKERVSGTVYAYAFDHVIEISMDGKSAPQLEAEIQQRLADAGIAGATVSVSHPGGDPNELKVRVEAKRPPGATGQTPESFPELVLTKNGAPAEGHGFSVRIEKRHSLDGMALTVRVHQGDKSGVAEVPRSDSMSDAALGTALETQLNAAGLDVTVSVTGGEIDIKPRVAK